MHAILVCLVCIFFMDISVAYVADHSFIFISGWPQSGTSLLHELLEHYPSVSTMISKCNSILGKRCLNWNHEGQWILQDSKSRDFMKSGEVCPVETVPTDVASNVRAEWAKYWSLKLQYLVEKSPQSFVKLPMLTQIFGESRNLKFLIILKHPVTLNVATPRDSSWAYFRDLNSPVPIEEQVKERIDANQRIENAKHFLNFMTQNDLSAGGNCSLGWLPAFSSLLDYLKSDNRTLSTVRIVRYEMFSRPLSLCSKIFNFIFDSDVTQQRMISRVCGALFDRKVESSSTSAGDLDGDFSSSRRGITDTGSFKRKRRDRRRDSRQLLSISNNTKSDVYEKIELDRRQLRLRSSQDSTSFSFRSELVMEEGYKRIKEFLHTLHYLPADTQGRINNLEKDLEKFGYSLHRMYEDVGNKKRSISAFSLWEL